MDKVQKLDSFKVLSSVWQHFISFIVDLCLFVIKAKCIYEFHYVGTSFT
jgi:hypothetical protein